MLSLNDPNQPSVSTLQHPTPNTRKQPMLYLSLSSAVAADSTVALSLCLLLFASRTGIKRTDSLLTLLIAFSINTGLLTR
ncbi:hypothetical protein NLJ89_g2816 [Agrocybe chaxingu]|uniref:DUF6534 domain-containing protein n=1 Tax=Agrocybe chaxingu TaxID=84603 RepID=A0A9W8K5V3_9AGAR|nr:hypothetical protein NLJ89_g2816 [Agrocybe chaxingu]